MFKVTMKSNANEVADALLRVSNKIKNKSIAKGLDSFMLRSTEELRKKLGEALDQVRERRTIADPVGTLPEEKTSIPKSEKDVLQFLLAKNSELERDRKPSEKNFYNNVHFVQNLKAKGQVLPHLRVTVPAKRNASLESIYMSAVESFANGVIVYEVNGRNEYFILSNRGRNSILDYAKKVCSRYSGVESLNKPETRKRRQAEIKKGLNSSTWAIKQEFVERLVRGQDGLGINITSLVESLKYGEIDQAETTLAALETQVPEKMKPAVQKVRNLKENKATLGDESPYVKAAEFVKNVKFQKQIEENKTTYAVSSQDPTPTTPPPNTIQKTTSTQKAAKTPAQAEALSLDESWEEVLRKVLSQWLTDKEMQIVIEYTKILIDDIISELEKG